MARNYSDKDVYSALEEIEKGATIAASARKYGIPRSTLSEKRSGRHPIEHRMGPGTVLSQEEENLLQKWIFHVADAGFPITKDQLLDSVQMILKKAKRDTIFTDNRPGRKWYEGFKRRHPLVSEKESQNLNGGRASVSEANLRGWYEEVRQSLTKLGNVDILDDPERVFNMDESGFYLSPKPGKVLARRGQRRVYSKVSSDEKEIITSLIGGNAKGLLAPSLVMFPYQRLPANIVQNMPESWAFGRSPSGWMTCEAFYKYIANCFYPWLVSANIKLPIVLFVDGHASHISFHLSEFCADKGIILIALFPNATHLHQPMDVSVFHSLKTHWAKAVQCWRVQNDGGRLNREKFAPLLKEVLDRDISVETVANGFKKAGLYPFTADAIDYGQLIKKPKVEDVPDIDIVNSPSNEFLEQFETHLDPSVLLSFKNSAPEVNAQSKNSSLYEFWKQICGRPSSNFITEKENDKMNNIPEDIIIEYLDGTFDDFPPQENNIEIVDLLTVTGKDSPLYAELYEHSQIDRDENENSQSDAELNERYDELNDSMESVSDMTISAKGGDTFVIENDSSPIANEELAIDILLESDENPKPVNIQSNMKAGPSSASSSHIPSGFPDYFRDALFWPGRKPADKSGSTRNQPKTEKAEKVKIPAVLTSKDFREYLKKKEDEKEQLEKEKEERKIARELKKIEKLKQMEQKEKEKAEREMEKQRKLGEKEREKQTKQAEKEDRAIAKRKMEEEKLKEKAKRQIGKKKKAN